MDYYIIEHVLLVLLVVSNVIAWAWRPFREKPMPTLGTLIKRAKELRTPTLDADDFAAMSRRVQYDGQTERDRRYQ